MAAILLSKSCVIKRNDNAPHCQCGLCGFSYSTGACTVC